MREREHSSSVAKEVAAYGMYAISGLSALAAIGQGCETNSLNGAINTPNVSSPDQGRVRAGLETARERSTVLALAELSLAVGAFALANRLSKSR